MASGDAVAPTAIDRPQCFIEKEKGEFPLSCTCVFCRVVCFRGDDVYATTTRGSFLYYMYIYIFIHIMRRCLLT